MDLGLPLSTARLSPLRSSSPEPLPPGDDLDAFAAAVQRRLQVYVSGPACGDAMTAGLLDLTTYRGHRSHSHRKRIELSRGGYLHLCSQLSLGRGTYAKVVPAWVGGPVSGLEADMVELVAVKKCSLARLRRMLRPAPDREADEGAVARYSEKASMRERRYALLANSPSAPYRAVVTSKQTYLLMPLFAASLAEITPSLRLVCVSQWVWGAYVLAELLPQVRQAHDNDVVHHDLSTSNILLRGHHFTLTDFGIARPVSEPCDDFMHGTAWCSAPETLAACAHAASDARCNEIFALGCIALVTGAAYCGNALYLALVDWGYHPSASAFYGAYASGWPYWCAKRPLPVAAALAAPTFGLFTEALNAWPPEHQPTLLALMHPDPLRRPPALAQVQAPMLSHHQLGCVRRHLDGLSVGFAEALCRRLSAYQL